MVLVSYVTGLLLATAGMPIIPATGLGVVSGWYKDNGKYDMAKAYSSNGLGNVVDNSLGNSKFNTISPVVRESISIYILCIYLLFKKVIGCYSDSWWKPKR